VEAYRAGVSTSRLAHDPALRLPDARGHACQPGLLCLFEHMPTSSSLLQFTARSLPRTAGLKTGTQTCTSALPQEQQPGLTYSAWRAPLRNGLYMYACRAVYEDADPAALCAFALDDAARGLWDDNHVATTRLDGCQNGDAPAGSSCIHHYRCRTCLQLSAWCSCCPRGMVLSSLKHHGWPAHRS